MFSLNEGILGAIRAQYAGGLLPEYFLPLSVGFVVISMVVGYLLGSLNSAIIVSKVLYRDDIRKYGSGNAGLTNMLRTFGKGAAGLTLLGDLAKTAISILIAGVLGGFGYVGGISVGIASCDFPLVYIAGLFSVVGHIFPIYYNLKGGKGVLCTAVMALILTPVEFGLLLLVFIALVCMTKYVSLGSVAAAALYPVMVHGHFTVAFGGSMPPSGILSLITIILAILIVYCHRENLRRIGEGTERRISIGKSPKQKAAEAEALKATENIDEGNGENEKDCDAEAENTDSSAEQE